MKEGKKGKGMKATMTEKGKGVERKRKKGEIEEGKGEREGGRNGRLEADEVEKGGRGKGRRMRWKRVGLGKGGEANVSEKMSVGREKEETEAGKWEKKIR